MVGNHEFYGFQRYQAIERMRDTSAGHGVHFLDDDVLQLQDPNSSSTVRFLGAT